MISELRSAGLKALSLSVDEAGPLDHGSFRGIEGVFDRTTQAWEAAREYGLKVQINTTAVRANLPELPGIARMVLEHGATLWSLFLQVPVGRGLRLEQISAVQCEVVMNSLYDTGQAIRVKTTEGHHFRRVVLERTILERRGIAPEPVLRLGATYRALRSALEPWPSSQRERRSPIDMNAGRGLAFVSPTGEVHPSGFLPITADSVRARSLGEDYRKSPLFKSLRDISALTGRYGRCEFAGVCGGSRARAFAVGGDALGEDPLCGTRPEVLHSNQTSMSCWPAPRSVPPGDEALRREVRLRSSSPRRCNWRRNQGIVRSVSSARVGCGHRLTSGIGGLRARSEFRPRPGYSARRRLRDGERGRFLLVCQTVGADLGRRLGLEAEIIGTRTESQRTQVVRQGRLMEIPAGFALVAPARLTPIFRSRLFSMRGKLRRRSSH
jgi:MoaA/NifB/PqqE/SkfB family radical SAM enzyme